MYRVRLEIIFFHQVENNKEIHIAEKDMDLPFVPISGLTITFPPLVGAEDGIYVNIKSVEWSVKESIFICRAQAPYAEMVFVDEATEEFLEAGWHVNGECRAKS